MSADAAPPDSARLLQALRDARAALEKAERQRHEPVAIVGLGCRVPGADDPDAFWSLLTAGRDAIGEVPTDRWDNAAIFDADRRTPGRTYVRHGAFIALPDRFDAEFFGISPREAARLDPQQRLLLECAWDALEDAGATAPGERRAGVFVGIGQSHWADLHLRPDALEAIDPFSGTGSLPCFAAGRLSHWLGFTGPSLGVDTACSSSLVALHLACQSLRQGESDLALAAGVHLNLAPHVSVFLSRTGVLAPDGRTKAFDAAADGFGRGEGCVVLALKRLSDALADGDRIHALVRGSAVNHDGAGAGLTVPSEAAQAAVLRAALADARVAPQAVGYVEAHGTGTVLGDPIEARALAEVFAQGERAAPLLLGAVKSNIGHLEAAAGLAGVLKAVLALQHGVVPPQCRLGVPNPHIPWESLPFALPRVATPWPLQAAPRIAGVSAFGMSGTNAHVVLEAAPELAASLDDGPAPAEQLLVLSARTPAALDAAVERWRAQLLASPQPAFADLCGSAATRRRAFEHRIAVVAESASEAATALARAGTPGAPGLARGRVPSDRESAQPVFLFTGQGAQSWDMGRELMQREPRFRAMVERCAAVLDPLLEKPLLDVLHGPPATRELIHRTDFTQPALFTLQVALADLWRGWGVEPAAVVGHSIGEYAAAWVAGLLELEDALRLVAARGRLMHALPGNGSMAALVAPDAAAVAERLRARGAPVSVAARNSPRELVIAGERAAVRAVLEDLAAQGIVGRELAVSHAFHSPLMAPMREALRPAASAVAFGAPRIDMLSSVDLQWNAAGHADYWCRQVVEAVDFRGALETLDRAGHRLFLELGPRPVLCGLGRATLGAQAHRWIPSLLPGTGERRGLLQALGELFVHGVPYAPRALAGDRRPRAVDLPHYPFQRSRHWTAPPAVLPARSAPAAAGLPLAGRRLALPFAREIRYETALDAGTPWLRDHQVFGGTVVAAACQLATVLEAAADALRTPRLALHDIRFAQALVLPPQGQRRLQVLLEPQDEGGWRFRTLSCAVDADAADPQAWAAHASGRLRGLDASEAGARPLDAPFTGTTLDAQAFHAPLAALGFGLGASYHWIETLRGTSHTLQARLRGAASADPAPTPKPALHPGLLDACFQALSRFWPVGTDELLASGTLYVPFAIDTLALFAWPPAGDAALDLRAASAEADPAAELTPPAALQLRGARDQLLLEASGFRFRRTGRAGLLAGAARGAEESPVLRLDWQAAPAASAPVGGTWLLLADAGGIAQALAAQLRAQGARCQLLEGAEPLPALASQPAGRVIDLRPLDLGPATDAASLTHALREAFARWQSLLRACAGATPPPRLWLVTRGSQPAGTAVGAEALAQAALWGLVSAAAAEHAHLHPGCIDLDPQAPPDAAALARCLAADDAEDWIALRGGQRLVARLARAPQPAAALPLRVEASYLVTGGYGALGLQVAQALADQGARTLVLAGRHRPAAGTPAQAALDALRARGVEVHAETCDIGDAAQAEALFQRMAATLPPLRGVVHAAGALGDGLLLQQEPAAAAAAWTAKVAGGWHLHRLTRALPLDFLLLFASAATLVGARGQAAYAMGNSFLDALAHWRRAQGLPATAVDWGAWSGAGMAAGRSSGERQRWTARGFGLIEPREGLALLGPLVASGAPQSAVLPLALPAGDSTLPPRFASLRASHPATPPAQPVQARAIDWTRDRLQQEVRGVLAATLGLADAQALEPQARLFEIGFDSLLALEAAERLATLLQRPLHDTVLFEYPTLAALTAYLAGLLAPAATPQAPAPIPSAAALPPGALDEQAIAALPEEEAERLLLAQLQALADPAASRP